MKHALRKFSLMALPVVGILLATPAVHAQQAVGNVIKAGQEDANKLIQAYIEPGGKAVGHGLNGGWFNSGKAMGLGRFDVRIFATGVFVPKDQTSFDISKLDLKNIRPANGESTIAPTIFGSDDDGPGMVVYGRNPVTNREEELTRFNTPPGIGFKNLPVPMAQVSVGLIKDTEIAVRFIPETKHEEYSGKLWGLGVKHGLKQWIPVVSAIPGFDITAFGGYTHFETAADLDINPDAAAYRTTQQQQAGYYDNQQLVFTTKAWTASLVASKTLSVITAYGGLRYSHVSTDVNVNGRFPITSFRVTPPNRYIEDVENPVMVKVEDSQIGLTAGLRLKLAFFSIYGEGTLAKYPTATAGIGLGFN
ncbi:DUF6588 family protein [Rufibacter sediminis]|uniref:Transporter n=1 Tax=Rufibacter sediminis TaxID=2762756 RepID=A0ABR6VXH9_9BACT|nr:DUF6588 family protein [Rufibacter sediminis]MBC3541843.1 hypothetical protein [Rufibacter sediminis]